MILPGTLRFLSQLRLNNRREWLEEHRKEFEAAKFNFLNLTETLLKELIKKDRSLAGLEAKHCTFRINRDIRFSKDKSPYKTNMGAYFNPGGKKNMTSGYYFHLEPGKSFVAGGFYFPPAPILQKIRQEIDYNQVAFEAALKQPSFRSLFKNLVCSAETQLQRVPKGYSAEHPAADYLRLKSFVAIHPLTNKNLSGSKLDKEILRLFSAVQPLIHFLNQAVDIPE